MSTLPLADVKARLSAVVDEVQGTHERVVITRNGRPAAVLVSADDLAALEETLDVLSQPGIVDQLASARAELDRGEGLNAEQLRAAVSGRAS
ncbi:MAG: prevent-host-death family protein [Frankiales bacterium]|nr:prevent-host-death family protein [Frankiales bacterium]